MTKVPGRSRSVLHSAPGLVRRPRLRVLAVLGVLAMPGLADAAVETFHRFEAVATANYTATRQCPDGSTVPVRVTVIGGHEEESESGVSALDGDFLTVLIRGFDCDGTFVNDRGSVPPISSTRRPCRLPAWKGRSPPAMAAR